MKAFLAIKKLDFAIFYIKMGSMADTSTVQSNASTVQSSSSSAAKSTSSASAMSRSELLKRVLAQQTFGLLCLRLVLGSTMIAYGVPKLLGGADYLVQVGSAVQHLGINFGFQFFGIVAALIEVVCGFMLIIGAYYRASCFLLVLLMGVAAISQKAGLSATHTSTDFIMAVVHPLSMMGVFLAALFLGPGRLSVQKD